MSLGPNPQQGRRSVRLAARTGLRHLSRMRTRSLFPVTSLGASTWEHVMEFLRIDLGQDVSTPRHLVFLEDLPSGRLTATIRVHNFSQIFPWLTCRIFQCEITRGVARPRWDIWLAPAVPPWRQGWEVVMDLWFLRMKHHTDIAINDQNIIS